MFSSSWCAQGFLELTWGVRSGKDSYLLHLAGYRNTPKFLQSKPCSPKGKHRGECSINPVQVTSAPGRVPPALAVSLDTMNAFLGTVSSGHWRHAVEPDRPHPVQMAITGIIQRFFPKCQHHKTTQWRNTRGQSLKRKSWEEGTIVCITGKNGNFPALFLLPSPMAWKADKVTDQTAQGGAAEGKQNGHFKSKELAKLDPASNSFHSVNENLHLYPSNHQKPLKILF